MTLIELTTPVSLPDFGSQPDIATIMWRYFFQQTNSASEASRMTNQYLTLLTGEEQQWF